MVDLQVYFKDKDTNKETVYTITVSKEELEKHSHPLDKWLFVRRECTLQLETSNQEEFDDFKEQ